MADGWTMGLPRWLVVLILVNGFRSGLGDINVKMEKTVAGFKGESVVIPCTYTTSNNEEVVKIEWEFKGTPVIHRDDSDDHIKLAQYRPRASLPPKSPAGDISLTLKKLDMDDRGNFKCKVTGRDGSGKIITQEDITELKVSRTRPATEKPKVTTEEAKVTTEEAKLTTRASKAEDDSGIVNTKQPRRFHSSTISVLPLTTNVMHDNPAAEAIKGSGIFFYVLIIGLLCLISIVILSIVLLFRRKKRKSFAYNLPSMNQLALNLEERSRGGGGCQALLEPASNDYEPCFPVSQYESLPITSEYEELIIKNAEGNDVHCETAESCAKSV